MTEPIVGETLLLDLLNSTPVVDGVAQDLLAPGTFRRWLREHGGSGTRPERDQVCAARDALQAVVRGAREPASLATLLAGVRSVPTVEDDGVVWTTEVTADRRLAVQAVLAWDEVHRYSPGRLRPCANPDCTLFLLDHSKPNRARWCSMAVCGNRMKARRHYERTRGKG